MICVISIREGCAALVLLSSVRSLLRVPVVYSCASVHYFHTHMRLNTVAFKLFDFRVTEWFCIDSRSELDVVSIKDTTMRKSTLVISNSEVTSFIECYHYSSAFYETKLQIIILEHVDVLSLVCN